MCVLAYMRCVCVCVRVCVCLRPCAVCVCTGHEPEATPLRLHPPKKSLEVPTLPSLNHSQLAALKAVLAAPISLVQGPPGTGKTVTSAAVIYHIVQVRVCKLQRHTRHACSD